MYSFWYPAVVKIFVFLFTFHKKKWKSVATAVGQGFCKSWELKEKREKIKEKQQRYAALIIWKQNTMIPTKNIETKKKI